MFSVHIEHSPVIYIQCRHTCIAETEFVQNYGYLCVCACLCVSMQGEKGEAGVVIMADGSLMSDLGGAIGPQGIKVTQYDQSEPTVYTM